MPPARSELHLRWSAGEPARFGERSRRSTVASQFRPTSRFPTNARPQSNERARRRHRAVEHHRCSWITEYCREAVSPTRSRRRIPRSRSGRFLTDIGSVPDTPPPLSERSSLQANGDPQRRRGRASLSCENQGDAWTVTSAYLDRFVEEQRLLTAEAAEHSDEQAAYVRRDGTRGTTRRRAAARAREPRTT